MKIRIYDVGRSKKSTTLDLDVEGPADYVARAIYGKVLRMGALSSKDIEVTWDMDAGRGEVFAGAHVVGYAAVVP